MIILPRSNWNAAPSRCLPQGWAPGGPKDLVVHWVGGSGTLNLSDHSKCPAAIRNVQAYEMSKEYCDIAYNLVLCPHGFVYEGRGLQFRGAANGPATNGTKPSVCLLLNQQDHMTAEMQQSIRLLRAFHTPGQLFGHREVNTTSCPGDEVFAWIIAERVPRPPAPGPVQIGDDEMKLMRGDKTPEVWLCGSGWKTHITATSYGAWKLWLVANVPGACDPRTSAEWVVPQVMVDNLRDTAAV